jgi:hypothetical protein
MGAGGRTELHEHVFEGKATSLYPRYGMHHRSPAQRLERFRAFGPREPARPQLDLETRRTDRHDPLRSPNGTQ